MMANWYSSGAEFALIPSRDEPFGLVAVEFGRKGALGIGARVGGLGNMPGWWFTVESTTPTHLLAQFESAIKEALASTQETRASMRATSALQRFPVQVWVKQLEKLQAGAKRYSKIPSSQGLLETPAPTYAPTRNGEEELPPGTAVGPDENDNNPATRESLLALPRLLGPRNESSSSLVRLSIQSVTSEKNDFALSKLNVSFTDADGHYAKQFVKDLEELDPKSSKGDLCIEGYLTKCEKQWFNQIRLARLGLSSMNTSGATLVAPTGGDQTPMAIESGRASPQPADEAQVPPTEKEKPPTGIKLLMQRKIGDWPLYSFLLAIVILPAVDLYVAII
jgi:alpha-1,3-glucan synthase